MYSVVLVCLGIFQEYILTNIEQLVRLNHTDIYVLTNKHIVPSFETVKSFIKIVVVEDMTDPFEFNSKSSLNKVDRDGFWHHASARFFVIYSFMLKYGVQNVIHIENDVLLYYNCDEVLTFEKKQVYIPFDTFERNVASIVYIPDASIFGEILNHYNFEQNDMYNFSEIRKKTGLITNLPIFVRDVSTLEKAFVTDGFTKYIFDAAAIGQFIGGVDPRNIEGDTRGFVNETCVIKYNEVGEIVWNQKKPFIRINETEEVPIFNLHIHCKNLSAYC